MSFLTDIVENIIKKAPDCLEKGAKATTEYVKEHKNGIIKTSVVVGAAGAVGYKKGQESGYKKGYEDASRIYEKKFKSQADYFKSIDVKKENKINELNKLLDEYEKELAYYENKEHKNDADIEYIKMLKKDVNIFSKKVS